VVIVFVVMTLISACLRQFRARGAVEVTSLLGG